MANIVNTDSFVGYYNLSANNYSLDDLQSYIDQYEEYYLCKLLGSELKDLFVADLVDGVPQNAEYLKWFEPFCEDETCGFLQSLGVKKMLIGFIYYHYLIDDNYKHTTSGLSMSSNENGEILSPWNTTRVGDQRYNDSVITFNAIRRCFLSDSCCEDLREMKLKFGDLI